MSVPLVYPLLKHLGVDGVWFGVLTVMLIEIGLLTPPFGINVFVINSIARDVTLGRIYRGTMPFITVDVLRLVILCAFPAISLWLPAHLN